MPRTQRTFSIIPDGASIAAAAGGHPPTTSSRPMTSKQVRKAYRTRTKGPTMSKAERLLWERREQERIRKEVERERTAAKAKALRERKRERDREEREEKRRNGMPLVGVRPSQDTISRFVRGVGAVKGAENGEKTTRQLTSIREGEDGEGKEELELPEGVGEDGAGLESSEPGSRRSALPVPIPVDTGKNGADMQSHEKVKQEEGEAAIPPKVEPTGRDCDSLLLESFELDSDDDYDINILWEPIRVPKKPQDTSHNDILADLDLDLDPDLLSAGDDLELEMLALETITPPRQPIPRPSSHKILHPTSFEKDLGLDKRFSSARRDRAETPTNPPKQSSPLEPPLSTQAIISNVDDFFPTASQLELELRGDGCSSRLSDPSQGIASLGSPKRFFASFSDEDSPCTSSSKKKHRSHPPRAEKRPVASLPPPNKLPLTQRTKEQYRKKGPILPVRHSSEKGPTVSRPPPSQESFDGDWLDDAASELLV